MVAVPGPIARTTPVDASTVATAGFSELQTTRALGIVSPAAFRADAPRLKMSPTSTDSGGARIAMEATYGGGAGVEAEMRDSPSVVPTVGVGAASISSGRVSPGT